MSDRVNNLRQQYPVFEYKSYAWEKSSSRVKISWVMQAGNLLYHPSVDLQFTTPLVDQLDDQTLNLFVFLLGLAEIPSYWKATCSPVIRISAGSLSPSELSWWHQLYLRGMGQYFFENQIDFTPDDFLLLQTDSSLFHHFSPSLRPTRDQALVLASGGKDSCVTLSLLHNHHLNFSTLALNPSLATTRLLDHFSLPDRVTATRALDPALLELNQTGYLNGHVPFSAYLAFLGLLVGYLNGNELVIASNEASSEEGNVTYLGHSINHQYSKTFAFELDLQRYCTELGIPHRYFSFLRPLGDLQIMGIFARFPSLFPLFRSCNVGQTRDLWCTQCAKCLSTFILLRPFVSSNTLLQIFGRDLLADPSLFTLLQSLRGQNAVKPFECVGTTREIESVLSSRALTPLLTAFGPHRLPAQYLACLRAALPITLQ